MSKRPKYPALSSREVIVILRKAGFKRKRSNGSHALYEGRINGEQKRVTVQLGVKDFKEKTMNSMIHQSGLSVDAFYGLLGSVTILLVNCRSWFN